MYTDKNARILLDRINIGLFTLRKFHAFSTSQYQINTLLIRPFTYFSGNINKLNKCKIMFMKFLKRAKRIMLSLNFHESIKIVLTVIVSSDCMFVPAESIVYVKLTMKMAILNHYVIIIIGKNEIVVKILKFTIKKCW